MGVRVTGCPGYWVCGLIGVQVKLPCVLITIKFFFSLKTFPSSNEIFSKLQGQTLASQSLFGIELVGETEY